MLKTTKETILDFRNRSRYFNSSYQDSTAPIIVKAWISSLDQQYQRSYTWLGSSDNIITLIPRNFFKVPQARFKNRISHVTKLMLIRKIYCFSSFALDSAHNNSQHCWANNVGRCCVGVGSGVQTEATTPNNVKTCSVLWEEYKT